MPGYRSLLARPGAPGVAAACAAGWLAFQSYVLAIVLAVHAVTGSFRLAGATTALFALASAALAPLRGRAVDRRGRPALLGFAATHTGAMTLLAATRPLGGPVWLLLAAAALAGAAAPPLIATARATWPRVAGPDLARTGHALNAALGDAAGVAGPAVTGAVAAAVSPLVALAALAAGPGIGALLLARAAGPRPGAEYHSDITGPRRRGRPARRWAGALGGSAGLRTIVFADAVLGVTLGALEVTAPAAANHSGSANLGALPLACLAAASAAASLWSGTAGRRPAAARYAAGWLMLAIGLLPAIALRSLAGLIAVAVAAGPGLGIMNTAAFELLDQVTHPRNAVEALTWLTTMQGLGLAAGSAAAGQLAGSGGTGALALVAMPSLLAAAGVALRRHTLRAAPVPPPGGEPAGR